MAPFSNLEALEAQIAEYERQVAELRLQADAIHAAERKEAIAFVRAKMEEYDITLRDLGLRLWTGADGKPCLSPREAWPFPVVPDDSPDSDQIT